MMQEKQSDAIIDAQQSTQTYKGRSASHADVASIRRIVKYGDIFKIGQHRLMCGDAKKTEDFALLLEGKKANMVFADPPYNLKISATVNLGKTKHREFVECSGTMSEDEFTAFLRSVFQNLIAHTQKASIHYLCMDWRHSYEMLHVARQTYARAGKDWLKNRCTWIKHNAGMGTFYRSQHEDVYVFKNGIGKHINNFKLGQYGRYRTNVWKYTGSNSFAARSIGANGKRTNIRLPSTHPTPKPFQLVCDAILDCSNKGDIVLDCFLGSGTTLFAAEHTQRICYGMELDGIYCDEIIKTYINKCNDAGIPTQLIHLNGSITADDYSM